MSLLTTNAKNLDTKSKKYKTTPSNKEFTRVSYKNKNVELKTQPNYHLYLIFIVLCIVPVLVKLVYYNPHLSNYNWFPNTDTVSDLFLIFKQKTILIIAGIMTLIILLKVIRNKKNMPFPKLFIPVILYLIFTILSTVFSKYISTCIIGGYEQFESIFVIIGYFIIMYYSFLFIKTEQDIKLINYFLIGTAIVLSILGILQFSGHDFFTSELGYNLVVPVEYRTSEGFDKNIILNQVYMTLYNPNYVGTYVSLILPIIAVMLLFEKKVSTIILSGITIIGLIICAIGAFNLTSMIGLSISIILILIFMRQILFKRLFVTIPIILIVVFGFIFLSNYLKVDLFNKLVSNIVNSKTEVALTEIKTEQDYVSFVYNGNTIKVLNSNDGENIYSLFAFDENNKLINMNSDSSTGQYIINDARFPDFILGWDNEYPGAFYVQIDGQKWRFTNITNDKSYYYINNFNKPDKIIAAPSAIFTGYERFATMRGYIWSRTIPLLKNYILLGSGPDTYTLVFPQQDYLDKTRYLGDSILTKPHNLYLQMIIQTGLLSLISFLTFYGIYFVTSIKLYIRGRYSNYFAKAGVAIFIGTVSYMVAGLTNDSNVNTAPLFWALLGIGITVNIKVKQLILVEDSTNNLNNTKK